MPRSSTMKDEDVLGMVRREPGIEQPDVCDSLGEEHSITPGAVKSRVEKLEKLGKIRIERRGRGISSLLWLDGQKEHDIFSGGKGSKETTRDRKFNAVVDCGLDIRSFITLPGQTILSAHSLEERILARFPQASGYGAEMDDGIYKELYYSTKKPRGFSVFHGDVKELIEDCPQIPDFIDLDFCGALTRERRDTVRLAFRKVRSKGIVALTVTNSLRKEGGYAALYPHSRNRQVCLFTELDNAAAEVGCYIDFIDTKPYVSRDQAMQFFAIKVRKEESFDAYQE